MNALSQRESFVARRVLLIGQVQGIGFRPALARLANQLELYGWVRNTCSGVEVHVEGPLSQVQSFAERCRDMCPASGAVQSKQVRHADVQWFASFSFDSESQIDSLSTSVPKDLAVCRDCLNEVNDPTNRRYGYLLTSCCQCGPRYTILEAMPYERVTSSMERFALCSNCSEEYTDPADRRYHAQTTCCARCGPSLENVDRAANLLRDGQIVCIKGIGGYQVLADAHNAATIEHLRKLKGRQEKPFAIMIQSVQQAETLCELQSLERDLLLNGAAPIVVVRVKKKFFPEEVSRGLETLGLMLPATPLHEYLSRKIGPLIVTSGNLEGEPIVFEAFETCESLKKIAKLCVDHDRPIRRPIDDSVVLVTGKQAITLRLARGLAPHPLHFGSASVGSSQHILAVGGHQKVAIALTNGSQRVIGPHLGDMDTLASRQRFVEHVQDLTGLYMAKPTVIAHDLHDDYFTSQWSAEYATEKRIRTISVQHHHAHVVAGMIEPGWLGREVLGVAWDGTGLGTDGTIWGGEFIKATATGFERVACLRPFVMPGGEAAIREPWRIAVALVREVRAWDNRVEYQLVNEERIDSIMTPSINWPITSSMGRLYDAVATLVLPEIKLRSRRAGYEGHFAALLESSCDIDSLGTYPFPISDTGTIEFVGGMRLKVPKSLDWRPLIRAILEDLDRKIPESTIAMRFHRTLALAIRQVSDLHETLPVVLSGGVFQNRILVDLIADDFSDRAVPISIPTMIPINDGGLAAGQLAIASAILAKEQKCA